MSIAEAVPHDRPSFILSRTLASAVVLVARLVLSSRRVVQKSTATEVTESALGAAVVPSLAERAVQIDLVQSSKSPRNMRRTLLLCLSRCSSAMAKRVLLVDCSSQYSAPMLTLTSRADPYAHSSLLPDSSYSS